MSRVHLGFSEAPGAHRASLPLPIAPGPLERERTMGLCWCALQSQKRGVFKHSEEPVGLAEAAGGLTRGARGGAACSLPGQILLHLFR